MIVRIPTNAGNPARPKIDPEFEALIPPLSDEERAGLEASIVAEGCRDALIVWNGVLLDGHNRLEICERRGVGFRTADVDLPNRDAATAWIIQNQLGRRNLTVFSRGELAMKLEAVIARRAKERQRHHAGTAPGKPGNTSANICGSDSAARETRAEVAKAAGVSHETLRAVKFVAEHGDEATKAKLRSDPNAKVHREAKRLREENQRAGRDAKRIEATKAAPPDDTRIIIGDFRQHADRVADGSVSLIFTDPPYDREASKMLPDLAAFASAKLAEGGSLICYVGQTQLPAAIDAFRGQLRYWWTIACVHSGGATVMREYGVRAVWKPVLWFVKGTRHDNSIIIHDVMSGGKEKSHHDWQQAITEAAYWVERLCPMDGLVCDPFLGGGTTAAAAQKLGRKWVGFEIDPATAAIARGRVAG